MLNCTTKHGDKPCTCERNKKPLLVCSDGCGPATHDFYGLREVLDGTGRIHRYEELFECTECGHLRVFGCIAPQHRPRLSEGVRIIPAAERERDRYRVETDIPSTELN